MRFHDRTDAGLKLAERLFMDFRGRNDIVLFALPRGGAVLGVEVAKKFGMPFDLIVTRKIGHPGNEEFAIGAMAETGETVWDEAEKAGVDSRMLNSIVLKEKKEAKRRIQIYRGGRVLPDLTGKTAVIIDDGIATGATMRAAVLAAKHQNAKDIVVAVPHGAKDTLDLMRAEGTKVIALHEPDLYGAVGSFYDAFGQTTDDEVLKFMKQYGPKV